MNLLPFVLVVSLLVLDHIVCHRYDNGPLWRGLRGGGGSVGHRGPPPGNWGPPYGPNQQNGWGPPPWNQQVQTQWGQQGQTQWGQQYNVTSANPFANNTFLGPPSNSQNATFPSQQSGGTSSSGGVQQYLGPPSNSGSNQQYYGPPGTNVGGTQQYFGPPAG